MEPGDFVIKIVFGWEGAVAVLGESEKGMVASHRFPTFRADDSRLDNRFLLYFCKTVDALKRLQTQTSAEIDALLHSILDRAFKGDP